MSWIKTRFKSKCRECGKALEPGCECWWVKGSKGVLCRTCKEKAPEAPKPTPQPEQRRTDVPEQKAPEPLPPMDDLNYKDDGIPLPEQKECRKTKWVQDEATKWWENRVEFDEFVEISTGIAKDSSPKNCRASQNTGNARTDWDLRAGLNGARKMLTQGWPAGRAFVDKIGAKLGDIKGKVVRFKVQRDVAGFAPDVGAFCAGQPDCMFHYETHEIDGKSPSVIKIVVNTCTSAGVDADAMAVKGLAVIALVEALETAGKSVEVILAAASECYNGKERNRMVNYITVKKADEWMDVDRMAFIIGHPATFRRLIFCLWENSDMKFVRMHHCEDPGHGYGTPTEVPSGPDRGDIYIGKSHLLDRDWRDLGKVRDWIYGELKAQGVELSE